jgi:transcriptional regulator with XRE-family HTH domain
MFGTLLRFYREQAGLSQEALGTRIGFSKSQVAMVERGARPPKGNFITGADEVHVGLVADELRPPGGSCCFRHARDSVHVATSGGR